MFDTGVETVEPDPLCSWKGHCRRVGAGVGNKSMRSCMVVQELCMPSMIRPERRTSDVLLSDELMSCAARTNGCLDLRHCAFPLSGSLQEDRTRGKLSKNPGEVIAQR